jgi:hypothetical protein
MKELKAALATAAVVLSVSAQAQYQSSHQPGVVVPPHAVVDGKTLGEWSARWWQWAYSIPATDNPLLDLTGEKAKFGDVGPVFFLAGVFGTGISSPVTRSVSIPANKYIFFPLENAVDDNVGNGCTTPSATPCAGRLTIDQLWNQLEGFFSVTALHARLDGKPIDDLFEHRETAPAFGYTYPVTDNLVQATFGYAGPDAAGSIFPAVADGYYLMLRPLTVGSHTLNFGGTFSGFSLDITYQITVTAPQQQPEMLIP